MYTRVFSEFRCAAIKRGEKEGKQSIFLLRREHSELSSSFWLLISILLYCSITMHVATRPKTSPRPALFFMVGYVTLMTLCVLLSLVRSRVSIEDNPSKILFLQPLQVEFKPLNGPASKACAY